MKYGHQLGQLSISAASKTGAKKECKIDAVTYITVII